MEKNLGRGKKRAGVKIETKKKDLWPDLFFQISVIGQLFTWNYGHLLVYIWFEECGPYLSQTLKKLKKGLGFSHDESFGQSLFFLSLFLETMKNMEIWSIVIFLGTKGLIIIYFSLFYPVEVCSTGKDILWNWETFHSQLETKPRLSFRRKSDICIKHLAAGS